jgi:acyl-CoA thioester hydrolase
MNAAHVNVNAKADAEAFRFPVRVYWEDTDAGGVVFYANYLKFFERARTEWLRHRGVNQQRLRETEGGIFVVVETRVRYRRPARLDDLLSVSVSVKEHAAVSLTLLQQAWHGDTLLADGEVRLAFVHADALKPLRIPYAALNNNT